MSAVPPPGPEPGSGSGRPARDDGPAERPAPSVRVDAGGVRLRLDALRAHPGGGRPRVRAWDGDGQPLDVTGANGSGANGLETDGATAFAEETTLRLRVDGPPGVRLRVHADDPALVRDVQTGNGWAAGPVRVGSTAGWLRLDVVTGEGPMDDAVAGDGARGETVARALIGPGIGSEIGPGIGPAPGGPPRRVLRLAVEIVPSKLDYRRDLAALVDDLARLSDDLAAALVAPAAPLAGPTDAPAGGVLAPLAALLPLGEALDRAVRAALDRPLGAERRHSADAPAHRLRHAGPAAQRALARHADVAALLRGDLDRALPDGLRLPALALDPTLDTPEHRALAARLGAAAREARRVARALAPASGPRARSARSRLAALADRLDALLALPALAAATGPPPASLPLRATLAPGYRDAFALLARLRQRLRLDAALLGAARPYPLRPLHALYETWAFLAAADALATAAGVPLDPRRLVRLAGPARLPTLRGARLDVRLAGGVRLALVRAPTLAHGLAPQRPDLLVVRQRGDDPPVWHVLDAKYRLDARPDTVARLGVPAPPADALGALHRYRDALVDATGRRPVATAVALYPWRDDGRYAGSRLAGGLARLGVGALPTLPGATGALDAWMARIVEGDEGPGDAPRGGHDG